jgi:hypothetical protein
MSSRLADSLEVCYDVRSSLKEMRAGDGELESVLDSIFNELPATIEGVAAQQREVEQTTAANHQQETDQLRRQIAAVAEQQAIIVRDQAAQTAELQSARKQNAAMADQLAEQKRQTQYWHEIAQQKLTENETMAARQRDVEQALADNSRQETDRFQEQIAAVIDQLTLVERDQETQAAELQAAREQNAATEDQLAEQKRQTQHWQETAQRKTAEIEALIAQQGGVEQTTAANHQRETDQLRQHVAQLTEQQTLTARDLAAQAAELQSAREQSAAMDAQLAEQTRKAQHWQETAQQKLAEIDRITAQQRDVDQATAANHRQETDELRQQIAKLVEQQTLTARDLAAQTAELQSTREQDVATEEQLADQKRQTQHWQETAQQRLAEIEKITAQQREVEQTAAANHRREADQFRQQIAELAGQQALVERDHAARTAELQAAREQNMAIEERLADQTRQTQHWQETAQQKLAEIATTAASRQEVEQTAAANHQRETDELRRQIASLIERQALTDRDLADQAAELQAAREQNMAIEEQLADQTRQTQHWQETARQKLAEIETIAASRQEVEQTTAANHQRETDELRRQIASLIERQTLTDRDLADQLAELQSTRAKDAAMEGQLADQTRQTQHWQETAQQRLAEIEGIAAHQREIEQTAAANHRQETELLRQQVAALLDQQALVERELAVPPVELQAAREQNVAMADQLAEQQRQTQYWQEMAQRKLAEIDGIDAQQREIEQTTACYRQETDQFQQQIAELIEQQALVKREQAIQAAELLAAREQNTAMADQLADQKRETQRWQEMAACAKQVTELRALFEHRQACREAEADAGDEEIAARAAHTADLGRRVDSQADSPRLQPDHSDSVASQESSEQERLMAKHRAQWEELLRTRSRPSK